MLASEPDLSRLNHELGINAFAAASPIRHLTSFQRIIAP